MRKLCLMATRSISECAIITKDFSVVMSSISPTQISCLAKICEPPTICERSRPIWSCILLEYRASKLEAQLEQAHILHGDGLRQWQAPMFGECPGLVYSQLAVPRECFGGVHMCWKPDTPDSSAFRPLEYITASYSSLTICLRKSSIPNPKTNAMIGVASGHGGMSLDMDDLVMMKQS